MNWLKKELGDEFRFNEIYTGGHADGKVALLKPGVVMTWKKRWMPDKLKNWDIKDQLKNISVPTLSIGGKYDTMDPEHMKWIASEVQNGKFLYCENGSHLCMYDDQKTFFDNLMKYKIKRIKSKNVDVPVKMSEDVVPD